MKKELFAAAMLTALFLGALFNIRALDALEDDITSHIDAAEHGARLGAWDNAALAAQTAARLWKSKHPLTQVVLRHAVIEDVSDKLAELVKAVYSEDAAETSGTAEIARARIESMVSIERIKPGSVF